MSFFDSIDATMLGERLRIARSRSGLTQTTAAKALQMARTTLVAIEQGQRRVKPDELIALAHLYDTTINELSRKSAVAVDLVPQFRMLTNAPQVSALAAATLLNDLAAAELELERLLHRNHHRNYPAERSIFPGDLRDQAEEAALELRHRLGIGLAPISDIVALLELEMGVRIFIRPLAHRSLSGLFAHEESVGACILLNANHPRERRAMTASHEVGHLITSRRQPDMVFLDRAPQSREEKFASAFAPAFLMPATAVRSRFVDVVQEAGKFSPRHLVLLAMWMNVSHEAMCRRLEDLSLLRKGTWESLKERGFSGQKLGQSLGDGGTRADQSILPPRLWLLVSEAHDRELLTEGQLASLLRTDRVEIRRMLDFVISEDQDVRETVAPH